MRHETQGFVADPNCEYWDMVRAVLAGAGRSLLSERDLLRGIFDFEATGSIRKLAMEIGGTGIPDGAVSDPRWRERADIAALAQYREQRIQLRADLVEIVDTGTLAQKRFREVVRGAEQLLMVPRFHRGVLGHAYMTDGRLDPALSYGLMLLLNPGSSAYRDDTRRCQWEKCGKFFFVSDANAEKAPESQGVRRTKYCSGAHMMDAWKARKR